MIAGQFANWRTSIPNSNQNELLASAMKAKNKQTNQAKKKKKGKKDMSSLHFTDSPLDPILIDSVLV